MPDVKIHPFPALSDGDELIYAKVADWEDILEQLPAKRLSERVFRLCAIPLFARNLALGDVVGTQVASDGSLVVDELLSRSGHFGYRMWLGQIPDSRKHELLTIMAEELGDRAGCLFESYSSNLFGVDAPTEPAAEDVVAWLIEHESWDLEWEAANQAATP